MYIELEISNVTSTSGILVWCVPGIVVFWINGVLFWVNEAVKELDTGVILKLLMLLFGSVPTDDETWICSACVVDGVELELDFAVGAVMI